MTLSAPLNLRQRPTTARDTRTTRLCMVGSDAIPLQNELLIRTLRCFWCTVDVIVYTVKQVPSLRDILVSQLTKAL